MPAMKQTQSCHFWLVSLTSSCMIFNYCEFFQSVTSLRALPCSLLFTLANPSGQSRRVHRQPCIIALAQGTHQWAAHTDQRLRTVGRQVTVQWRPGCTALRLVCGAAPIAAPGCPASSSPTNTTPRGRPFSVPCLGCFNCTWRLERHCTSRTAASQGLHLVQPGRHCTVT